MRVAIYSALFLGYIGWALVFQHTLDAWQMSNFQDVVFYTFACLLITVLITIITILCNKLKR